MDQKYFSTLRLRVPIYIYTLPPVSISIAYQKVFFNAETVMIKITDLTFGKRIALPGKSQMPDSVILCTYDPSIEDGDRGFSLSPGFLRAFNSNSDVFLSSHQNISDASSLKIKLTQGVSTLPVTPKRISIMSIIGP